MGQSKPPSALRVWKPLAVVMSITIATVVGGGWRNSLDPVSWRRSDLPPPSNCEMLSKQPYGDNMTKKPTTKKSTAKAPAKAAVKKPALAAKKPATKPAKAAVKKPALAAKKPATKPTAKSAAPKKQTTDKTSSIAGTVLKTAKATVKQVKTLAGSVLGQDETKGRRKK